MIYVVKCEYGKMIQLPCGVSESRGEQLRCPADCPSRKMCSMSSDRFRIAEVMTDDGRIGRYGDLIRYSASEAGGMWGKGKAVQSYPDLDGAADSDDVEGDESIFEELKSRSIYNMISVRRNVFSNDPAVRRNIPMSRPLGSAMKEIFQYWDTSAVFENNTTLKDDFIWLMLSGSKGTPIYKSEVDAILNNKTYNRSQKFFHIFYDVVYKDNRPDGFFWCDDDSAFQPVMPRFKNKDDFLNYLFRDGGAGFKFYKARKDEVLSFLGVDSENDFFDELTCDYADDRGEVIWIDSRDGGKIRNFGSTERFIKMMHTPSDSETMQDMIEFLRCYTISSKGVDPRPSDIPFECVDIGKCSNEKAVLSAVGLPGEASVTNYAAYLSLLREYIKSFSPREIKVGQLSFTGADYARETEDYIIGYCKERMIYSEGGESADAKRMKNKALLAANLYETGVLSSFGRVNDDGLGDCTKLMYKIAAGGKDVDMHWYIAKMKNDHPADFDKRIESDRLVSAWFEEVLPKNSESGINGSFSKYENLYRSFRRNG